MAAPFQSKQLPSACSYGGHQECFKQSVIPERLKCSICTRVLREPHLMVCCGQKYCTSCLQNWFKKQKAETCPHCRATKKSSREPLHVLDKGLRSEIESLPVMCSNCEKGCEWEGELRDVDQHLNHQCGYAVEKCPNNCLINSGTKTRNLLRKDLELHLSCYCELRMVECLECGIAGSVMSMYSHQCGIIKQCHTRKSMKIRTGSK